MNTVTNTTGDAINDALEDAEQTILRRKAQQAAKGTMLYYGPEDTFDKIPGGLVVRRDSITRFREEIAREARRQAPPTHVPVCTLGEPWYLARHGRIETVRVTAWTDLYVDVVGERPGRTGGWPIRHEVRRSAHTLFSPTWAEAHAFLVERAMQERDVLLARLARAQTELDRVQAMAPMSPADLLAGAA